MTEKPQSRPQGKPEAQKQDKQQKPVTPKATVPKTDTKVVSPSIPVPTPTPSPAPSTSPSTPLSSETPTALSPSTSTPEKPSKTPAPKPVKKEEAIAKGTNLHASKKHCMYICNFIKGKSIDQAIKELEEVLKFKRVIPMKGEIPHRSAPGIMSGRYPIKTTTQFIPLLKALKGNAIVNGLELDKTRIVYGSSTWASRPQKRGGMRFKRAYVVLKAKEVTLKEKPKKEKKK